MQDFMKRIAVFFGLLAMGSLGAMYQSNPLAPELIDKGLAIRQDFPLGVKAGYQFDRIFDRYLSLSNVSGYVSEAKILANQGVLTLNFYDMVEVWGSSGAANFHIVDKVQLPTGGHQSIHPSSRSGWIWGTGIRSSLFTWGNTTLGGSASYENAHPRHLHYSEWQIGFGLAQKISFFIPYIGGNFSRAKASLRHVPHGTLVGYPKLDTVKMHNRNHWGLAVGCDFCTGKFADVGFEFRAFSELALTAKADIKF